MPLIEGIGDEVTIVMSILLLVITMTIAWISTLVSERPTTSLTFTRNEYLDQDLIQEDELPEEVYNEIDNNAPDNATDNNAADINAAEINHEVENISPGEGVTESDVLNDPDTTSLPDIPQDTNLINDQNSEECLESNQNNEVLPSMDSSCEKDSNESNKTEECNKVDSASGKSEIKQEEDIPSEHIDSTFLEPNNISIDNDNDVVEEIRIRLKFLNESERTVDVNPNVTLSQFKRDAFVEEISQGLTLRLILNGHILQDDQKTLSQLNINNNCVIHCQILEARTTTNAAPIVNNSELDIGQIMIPMFAVLLGLVWYVRLEYRHLFTATSTLSLLGVSVLFFLAVLASWRS